MDNLNFKSGFVALVGRTNVGKSTLINSFIGSKIVITSEKAQTTRNRINCIYNDDDSQIIFVDIPGFLKPRSLLTEKLNKLIIKTINDSDLILVMVDIASGIGSGDIFIFNKIKDINKPIILVINKIDIASQKKIKEELDKINNFNIENNNIFKEIILISALKNKNLDNLISLIKKYLPEGPAFYPDDILSDRPIRNIAEDIIREKLVLHLDDELPHTIAVEINNFEEGFTQDNQKIIKISAIIYAQKKRHKSIIIGKNGSLLKDVGMKAREELEAFLGCKVYLELWVKVKEDWTENLEALKEFGYDY